MLPDDACSSLNSAGLGNLLVATTDLPTTVLTKMYAAGTTLLPFNDATILTNDVKAAPVLATASTSSPHSLIKYLSGVKPPMTTPATAPAPKTVGEILLGGASAPKSIVKDLLNAQPRASIITRLTNVSLETVRDKLVGTDPSLKFLLSESQIFDKTQDPNYLTAINPQTASLSSLHSQDPTGKSLVYLTFLGSGPGELSTAQQTALETLYNTNSKFFSAFYLEYCFYRSRYVWLLKEYFKVYSDSTQTIDASREALGAAANGGATITGTSDEKRANYLAAIAKPMALINVRMQDMLGLLNTISAYYSDVFSTIDSNLNDSARSILGSNSKLKESVVSLNASAKEATDYIKEADVQRAAMDYASEKNRYGTMLLGLYAFLNLSALAIIYRVANS